VRHKHRYWFVSPLESFSCVFCQSKEFDRVTDWLKHSLQSMWCMSSIVLCSKMIIKDFYDLYLLFKLSLCLKCETQTSLLICFTTHFKFSHATHACVQCTLGKYCKDRTDNKCQTRTQNWFQMVFLKQNCMC
jgi:hypothetical protein